MCGINFSGVNNDRNSKNKNPRVKPSIIRLDNSGRIYNNISCLLQ